MEPATAIRASVVAASRLAIQSIGRDDDYFAQLEPAHRQAIRELSGVGWVDIAIADAHYRAADGLRLTPSEQRAIGRRVAERLRDSYAGAILRSLKAVGALSPYTALSRFPLAWSRLVQGGGARVYELAPHEIRVDFLRTSIARYGYVREGWAGMFEGTLSLVSDTLYVTELPELRGSDRCAFRVGWT